MNLFKKINRGLVLGGVLLFALTIYLVMDARAFESDVYEIQNTLLEFVQAAQDLNSSFSEETNAAYIERFFVEWRHPTWHPRMTSLRDNAVNNLRWFLDIPEEALITDMRFALTEIASVQKQTTNAARARFTVEIQGGGIPHDNWNWITFFTGFSHGSMGDEAVRMDVDALMLREGGQWRFASANVWLDVQHFHRTIVTGG